jgi:hypothetical protein
LFGVRFERPRLVGDEGDLDRTAVSRERGRAPKTGKGRAEGHPMQFHNILLVLGRPAKATDACETNRSLRRPVRIS